MQRHELLQRIESMKVIEQARGVLMRHYGVDGAAAFALLSTWSTQCGLAVHCISEVLVGAASQPAGREVPTPLISVLERLNQADLAIGPAPSHQPALTSPVRCDRTPASSVLVGDRSDAVARARQFVRDAVCAYHPFPRTDDAVCVASELVANGRRHGAPPVIMTVECLDTSGIQITVADHGPGTPHLMVSDVMAEGGRGLLMVDQLSQAWGVDTSTDGKLVWAVVSPQADEPLRGAV